MTECRLEPSAKTNSTSMDFCFEKFTCWFPPSTIFHAVRSHAAVSLATNFVPLRFGWHDATALDPDEYLSRPRLRRLKLDSLHNNTVYAGNPGSSAIIDLCFANWRFLLNSYICRKGLQGYEQDSRSH